MWMQILTIKTNNPAEVIDEVNTWAEVHTNVLINQILSKDSIEVIRQSTVIFANAVYIKGAWREKFNVRFTKDIVHLPYGNSPCIFIFPILEKDCPTLLEKVGSEPGFLDNHIPDYQIELADFRIPKFKFSFEFEASGILTEMVNSPTIGEKLYVSNILHKACIKVDEEGTEAAAVSIDVVTNSRDTVATRMKRIVSLTCTYHNCGLRFGLYVARTFAAHRPHMSKETLISRDANLRVLRFFRSVEGRSSFCNGVLLY
ncbi:BnaC08g48740D [Brassica napus]|uniref:BnaC08g48740D protein n=1 Tax=Brassica napus TaxID=3708 RepID=A0A078IZW5_BRANA|nr:BnaC08g48740D [Brassica napus]